MLSCTGNISVCLFILLSVVQSGCALRFQPPPPPPPVRTTGPTGLSEAVPQLGSTLLAPIRDEQALVLLEPFKEASLYDEIQASLEIDALLLELGSRKDFARLHLLSTADATDEELEQADYILRGVISYEPYPAPPEKPGKKYYKLTATLADRQTGQNKAHGSVWVDFLSYSRQDLPVLTADPAAKRKVAEIISNAPKITVHDITADALLARAKAAYRKGEYRTVRHLLEQLLGSSRGGQLDAYRMLYLTYCKLADFTAAETAFLNMITVGFQNSTKMPLVFLFDSSRSEFAPDRLQEYGIWIRQLVAYLMLNEKKCMHIIGHTSRQGSSVYNMQLSLARAEYIRNRLIRESEAIRGRVTAEGKGETATRDGSEPDSDQNMIDRRVEFELFDCRE
ncbi:MAG: OmpA family protein [Candidatus Electrothrix sp. YB6]